MRYCTHKRISIPNMKILINTPDLSLLGGVANHFLGLRTYWTENVKYNIVGKRNLIVGGSGILWLPWDILKFVYKLLFFHPDVVLLNPSLGKSALSRDFIFSKIAKLLGFPVVIFIHGFNLDYAETVNKKWVVENFNRCDKILVLADSFRQSLKQWGVAVPIYLTTTKVDDKMIDRFDINSRKEIKRNILFVSRIEKEKGIYESLNTFNLLKRKYKDLVFTIVGDGKELPAVKGYVNNNQIRDVIFKGRLDGEALKDEFKKSFFFFFFSYGEGMPTCVLEAMAFGMPIFTRKVGGLVDFFEQEKMGYITDSFDPKDFANAFEDFLLNPEKAIDAAIYNYKYAKQHFMASSVAKNVENILRRT